MNKTRKELPDPEIARFRMAKAAGLKTILFVCTGNAVRSQFAEGIVNHFFEGKWAAFSAGVLPMEMPKDVRTVMAEIGIEASLQKSKHVDTFRDCYFDRVIILCSDAGRFCPILPDCAAQDHIIFHDPFSSSLFSEGICLGLKPTLRGLRDEIKKTLLNFLDKI